MSGQNAKRNDELESVNNRLDSILNALDALGGSTPEEPTTPTPPTSQSTPTLQLVPDIQETPPNVEDPPPGYTAESELVPPTAPPVLPELDVQDSDLDAGAPPVELPRFETQLDVLGATPTTTPEQAPPFVETPRAAQFPDLAPNLDTAAAAPLVPEVSEPFPESVVEAPAAFDVPAVPESVVETPAAFEVPDVAHAEFAEPTSAAVNVADTVFVDPDTGAELIELDDPVAAGSETDEVTRPKSIFRTTAADAVEPAPVAASPAVDDDDEWVSHHIIEPSRSHELFDEVPPASATPASPEQLEGDALWAVEPYPAGQENTAPLEAPSTVQDANPEDLWGTVVETEEMLFSLDPAETNSEIFQAPDPTLSVETQVDSHASFDTVSPLADVHGQEVDESAPTYGTDEDLPIPDFTGVYDETSGDSAWSLDTAPVGASVEGELTQTTAMIRRDELDRLRPASEVLEQEEEEVARTVNVRLIVLGLLVVIAAAALYFFLFA